MLAGEKGSFDHQADGSLDHQADGALPFSYRCYWSDRLEVVGSQIILIYPRCAQKEWHIRKDIGRRLPSEANKAK